ncbi:MAG: adenylate/guanylate cyclase domain-containing protein [Oscillatoriales cyanobacterium RM2_1_1]|nr:adenylate/guanylate cyclase domain-containing protein [Oscillatoriales cyanobacterium SM2_3_0]NJO45951.1 adenylate/guanylate cyclase domain-containing protein [Oscillatoriales cyanobacterium RM2_1_1]
MLKPLRQRLWQWRGLWLTAPVVAGLVIGVRALGLLQLLEWAAWDQFIRWRPPEPIDQRIVLVEIGESDINQVKQWPISDGDLARLLNNIKQQQPRTIGLDIYRDIQVPPGSEQLTEVFQSTPNLIGIEKVVPDAEGASIPAPPVLKELGQVGAVDAQLDTDGKLRRVLLSLQLEDSEFPIYTLAAQLALIYLQAEGIELEAIDEDTSTVRLGQAVFTPLGPNDGGYVNSDAGGYQLLMNFRRRACQPQGPTCKIFQTISMTEVLNNQIPPDLFRDRIVLIGSTAASLKDLFFTPYSTTLLSASSGVEIHAETVSMIVSGALEGRPLIRVWPEALEWLWIGLWSILGATLGWQWRAKRWAIAGFTILGGGLTIAAYLAVLAGWWIPFVPPILALIGSTVAVVSYEATMERRDREIVMTLFGKNVTPKIAEAIWQDRDQILSHGRLQGKQMTATVLFSDLKGFTQIAEQMEAEPLMSWLNDYMDAMAQIVLDHDGIVDKFIGDAIMAVFGVPIPDESPEAIAQEAIAAVTCARAMVEQLAILNLRWKAQGLPTTGMRVGIATGAVVAGSLGNHQRLNYTTIGDSVNVASRLESYDKDMNEACCRILISEVTYEYLENKFPCEFIGCLHLRGRQQPVNVYQIL